MVVRMSVASGLFYWSMNKLSGYITEEMALPSLRGHELPLLPLIPQGSMRPHEALSYDGVLTGRSSAGNHSSCEGKRSWWQLPCPVWRRGDHSPPACPLTLTCFEHPEPERVK